MQSIKFFNIKLYLLFIHITVQIYFKDKFASSTECVIKTKANKDAN